MHFKELLLIENLLWFYVIFGAQIQRYVRQISVILDEYC